MLALVQHAAVECASGLSSSDNYMPIFCDFCTWATPAKCYSLPVLQPCILPDRQTSALQCSAIENDTYDGWMT